MKAALNIEQSGGLASRADSSEEHGRTWEGMGNQSEFLVTPSDADRSLVV